MKALACLDMNFGGARPAPNQVAHKVNQTECQPTECARDVRGTDEPHAECRMQTPCKEEGWVRAGEGGGVAMCGGEGTCDWVLRDCAGDGGEESPDLTGRHAHVT